jgi:hypothetical protein
VGDFDGTMVGKAMEGVKVETGEGKQEGKVLGEAVGRNVVGPLVGVFEGGFVVGSIGIAPVTLKVPLQDVAKPQPC